MLCQFNVGSVKRLKTEHFRSQMSHLATCTNFECRDLGDTTPVCSYAGQGKLCLKRPRSVSAARAPIWGTRTQCMFGNSGCIVCQNTEETEQQKQLSTMSRYVILVC